MKKPYTKTFKTYQEQLDQLKQRGMIVHDEVQALFYLQHMNYYRLCAYWLPFQQDPNTHQLKAGATFDEVYNLYRFDRELRLLVLDAIEHIEVSVRAIWAHEMAKVYGSHAHLDPTIWKNATYHLDNEKKLTEEVQRSKEDFIQHLVKTYTETLPPIWAVCEVMSLGLLSRYYKNLDVPSNVSSVKKSIAQHYGVGHPFLESVLHQLTVIRNICAHHGRLWNRDLKFRPAKATFLPSALKSLYHPNDSRMYNALIIMLHFMDVIAPQHSWRCRLKRLLLANTQNLPPMGFPENWESNAIWEDTP